jgi:hypothetical protein
MYWTIWVALALFAAGEIGRPARAAWWAWALGVALTIVHIVLAMAMVHGWSHAAAVAATARATDAVFGLDWGGGVFVNYLFVAVWAGETAWWRADPGGHARRPSWMRWTLRLFYLVILVNAAVIFAAGWRRWLGAALVVLLGATWAASNPRPTSPDAGSTRRTSTSDSTSRSEPASRRARGSPGSHGG